MSVVIGIDLGGTSAKFGLFDTEGHHLVSKSMPTGKASAPKLISEMADFARQLLKDEHYEEGDLLGIGIGVPGPVLDQSVVNGCVNLGWDVVNVRESFEANGITCPVRVENDANVAALGEAGQGVAKGKRSVAFLTIGTGIGGGLIADGKVIGGAHGAGGEVGHMPFLETPQKQVCGCGGRRCLEQVASSPHITDYAKELLEESGEDSLLRSKEKLDTIDIFEAAKQGDSIARQAIDHICAYLGRGMAIVGSILDPDCFVIGGGVSGAGETLLKPLRKAYQEVAFYAVKDTPIVKASLGNQAGMIGAAYLILNERA